MLPNRILLNVKYLSTCSRLPIQASHVHRIVKNKILNYEHPIYACSSLVRPLTTTSLCHKYNKQTSKDDDSDSDDDDNDPELKDERDSKVLKVKVNSLRADLILRAGLQMARNKIEVIFYESKIRVNGQKIGKKSVQLNVGDEIDVIRGFSNVNPSHLIISRVIIVAAKEKDEAISAHLRRYKSMLIENYAGMNAYKSSESNASA